MKKFLPWLAVMTLGLLALVEMLWRMDHGPAKPDAWSARGGKVAEVRSLPEGSQAPYGVGVYLRPAWTPLNFLQAELAFAGYCSAMHTRWLADDRLQVNCELPPTAADPWASPVPVQGVSIRPVVLRPNPVASSGP